MAEQADPAALRDDAYALGATTRSWFQREPARPCGGAFASRLRRTMTVPAPESKVCGTGDLWPCALRCYQARLVTGS
jgi:hypothetical protein